MQEKVIRAIDGEDALRLALETWFKGYEEDYFRIVSRDNQATAFKVKPPSEDEVQTSNPGDPEDGEEMDDEDGSEAQEHASQEAAEGVCLGGREALGKMIESASDLGGGSVFVEDTDVVLSVGSLAKNFQKGLAVSSFEFVAPATVSVSAGGQTRITVYTVFQRHPDSMDETSFTVSYRLKGASVSHLLSEVVFEQKKIFAYVMSNIEVAADGPGERDLELLLGEDVLYVHRFTALASSHVSEATLSDVIERYQSAEPNGE
ncbi:MAG TPA: hypothetical protein DIU35_02970 [Candidatus Latescibacteria bacterium]|nr:hypothetical protein [Gemmatimonadota bacterium]HCR16421.1 hypothetical protein [Candidatus Latescibacterota bacterium]|tara:strand:- start:3432 stop:4214 length:783 start_codon:yes stop_codon:yes gene_type:complete